jgi:hypothetical protein
VLESQSPGWAGEQGRGCLLYNRANIVHLMKPLREMISAWQSLTVSPFRLRESPFTQRFPRGILNQK